MRVHSGRIALFLLLLISVIVIGITRRVVTAQQGPIESYPAAMALSAENTFAPSNDGASQEGDSGV